MEGLWVREFRKKANNQEDRILVARMLKKRLILRSIEILAKMMTARNCHISSLHVLALN